MPGLVPGRSRLSNPSGAIPFGSAFIRLWYAWALYICVLSVSSCFARADSDFPPGEYRVGHQAREPVDAARDNRVVPMLIWYPADPNTTDGEPIQYNRPFGWTQTSPYIGGIMNAPIADTGPFPLIALSHGDGGVPEQFELLGEFLASYGYIVVAPQHVGNSGATPPQSAMGSHRPADISFAIDTMIARNATPGDLLSHAIDVGAIGVGGYSRGAATATAAIAGFRATRAGEFDTLPDNRFKALLLIDGTPNTVDSLTSSIREAVTLPTLSIGGSAAHFATNSNLLPATNPMYGVDATGATHNEFVSSCHFLNSLLDDSAPQEVLDFFGVRDPLPCDANLLPAGDVSEIVVRHTIDFVESQLRNISSPMDGLRPDRSKLSENVNLKARVVDSSGSSDVPHLVLTDPLGRQIGIDPHTGHVFSDFTADEIHLLNWQTAPKFVLRTDQLVPGHYVLTGSGNALTTEPRNLQVVLQLAESRAFSTVSERTLLWSGVVSAGKSIGPLMFDILPGVGDFDSNGVLDVTDVDQLASQVRAESQLQLFDLNLDGSVSESDVAVWIHDLKRTWFGDANLDGEFNSDDLIMALGANTYEANVAAGWSTGDFDSSGMFDTSDLVLALADGGYERGPKNAVGSVPEPVSLVALMISALLITAASRGKEPSVSRSRIELG